MITIIILMITMLSNKNNKINNQDLQPKILILKSAKIYFKNGDNLSPKISMIKIKSNLWS